MKKILLSALTVLLIGLSNTANAQCTFANPAIRMVAPPYNNGAGKCVVTLELSFDILHNAGGKYFWIHLWPTNVYPDYNYPQSQPPTTSIIPGGNGALDGTIGTFGFFHMQGDLVVQNAYPPDNNAPYFQSGYTISEISDGGILSGSDRYTITGLIITLPLDCSIPQSFTADLWESQSDKAQTVACVSKGVVIYANDPKVTGSLFCPAPRTYNFTITTINAAAGMVVSYNVYIDDGDEIYNKTLDTLVIATGNNIQLDNSTDYKYISGVMSYTPYSNLKPYADKALFVAVTSPSIPNEVYTRLDNICTPLPVIFKSFTAVRNLNNVLLKWEISSEQNNKGFIIERNISGTWQEVGFVASLANSGNSDISLNYIYNDVNLVKAITQYRIRQVDFDNQSKYSNVVAVIGATQSGKIVVYPNPSAGKVNVAFEMAGVVRDISLTDLMGRVIKQWRGVTDNNLRIDNLNSGIYNLRVIIIATGEQVVERIVVYK
jgi:hypothetical protein